MLPPHVQVTVVTKQALTDSASAWAQGGVAAVLDPTDSFDNHVQDTLVAGAHLSDLAATRQTVEKAPEAIAWLQAMGTPFTTDNEALHLTREGGHSHRRVVHAADATGAAIQAALVARVQQAPNVRVLESHHLVDLLMTGTERRCVGAQVWDASTGQVDTWLASHTVLCTGGAGQLYPYTTNPTTATGDGIAAAWRAGCRVSNLEFIQFHPTSLHHPEGGNFLITEAVRGEGGLLKHPLTGQRFMPDHDPRGELAPRDVVARAIDTEIKRDGLPCVHLDISHQPAAFLHHHFPNVLERCRSLGIDITRDPIPVVPAAHYTCGGVVTDLNARTDLPGLYCVGETSCTGLHGANRLASNSLLECVVFAQAAVRDMVAQDRWEPVPPVDTPALQRSKTPGALAVDLEALRLTMWDHVGIVRTDRGLALAAQRLQTWAKGLQDHWPPARLSAEALAWRSLVTVGQLVVRSAQGRNESRGLHFNTDHPGLLDTARPSVLVPC
jgi:L-aspartate oxidase